MAVITNKNTTQTPITTGLTGTQVVKFIDAARVYVKTKDTTATPVIVKSNGSTPSGWTDLGIVDGKVKVTYEKELFEVRTGIDNILRSTFVKQRTGSFEFVLSQFDDVVIKEISGITPSTITAGSIQQFAIGQEDVIEKALLLVVQNKLDGKEWQFYAPAAQMTFNLGDAGEATVVNGKGNLPAFTYNSLDTIMVASIFSA